MREFGQFLDANAGVPQYFHRRPGPEGAVFLPGQVSSFPGAAGVLGPDPAGTAIQDLNPTERDAGEGEQRARRDGVGGPQPGCGVGAGA